MRRQFGDRLAFQDMRRCAKLRRVAKATAIALAMAAPRAWVQDVPDTGPEDVPADKQVRLMTSTLVVPRTHVTRFRMPVVDVHTHP